MSGAVRGPGIGDDFHGVALEPSPRWVRAVLAGQTVVDSRRAFLVHETGKLPVYYFPRDDVRADLLVESEKTSDDEWKGPARWWTVRVGDHEAPDAVWEHHQPPDDGAPDLRGLLGVVWGRMDHWFEEAEEVYVHPRDPWHRVDAVDSSRHVRVGIDGIVVADSVRTTAVFETGLPTRWYVPLADVRIDLLEPSDTASSCPYKGDASYWSVRLFDYLHDDIAWTYKLPSTPLAKIAGKVAFFNERVDLALDGQAQERPRTRWSR